MNISFLSPLWQTVLFISSLLLVGFGQPAFSPWLSLLASFFGFALFWRIIVGLEKWKRRFWISALWFFCVQLIQLSWMVSHPYFYIYAVLALIASFMGLQFGLLGILLERKRLEKLSYILALAGFWTIMEWCRLFILSGFSFNPVGMALTANLYSLQFASVWGIFGLSFWVIFVNLLALRVWLTRWPYLFSWGFAAMLPFIYGAIQLGIHQKSFEKDQKNNSYTAILVQTAFPVEEIMGFKDQKSMIAYVMDEWRQILKITKKHLGTSVDLIATPEYTVPYGTYSCVFPHSHVVKAFREIYGPEHLAKLPKLEAPYAMPFETANGKVWMVNNAFWAQGIANIFNAELVAGLEDSEDLSPHERNYYSAALHFQPRKENEDPYLFNRYEKRVLVPMGEYIPSSFLKKLASWYGINGSFTPGQEAKAFGNKQKLGLSICYEETYGYIMRQSKLKGATVLLNLTSDVWYPYSRLMQQHFDHARPRTVENGMPLLRACNTGITAAIDCFGRVSDVLGESPEKAEWLADSIKVSVPTYTYPTVYSRFGDAFILSISFFAILVGLRFRP